MITTAARQAAGQAAAMHHKIGVSAMLVIRQRQIVGLETLARRRFEDSLVEHIATYFPNLARMLGEPRVRHVIDYGLARARLHGFTSERNLCLYLDLMLMLGSNFDVDPQLPWATQILTDPVSEHPTLRIDRLTNAAMDHMDRSAGADDANLRRVLADVRGDLPTRLTELEASSGLWAECAASLLARLWPERCALLGASSMQELIHIAYESASHYGLHSRRARAIYLVCTFVLGSHFDSDPQHPWAAAALTAEGQDGAAKAMRLYHDGMAWLAVLLAGEDADRDTEESI
jgi:hypothetical protein